MAVPRQRTKARGKPNRGVVLLIIVTLMTLFMMIGITLSLLAMNYKDSGEQLRASGTFGDLPERESDVALNQILFGTNQLSALSGHSLLEDLYGRDGYQGSVQSTPTVLNGGQALQINIPLVPSALPESILDHYSGRVITFLSGDAAGVSTRVLSWYPDPTNPSMWRLVIETPASDLPIALSVATGDEFLINGAPFNGTGAGYNPVSSGTSPKNLDATAAFPDPNDPANNPPVQFPVPLLPNYAGYRQIPSISPNYGGMDESYDAADYQDVWLSMIPPELGQGTALGQITLLPSYHRPDLVLFWFNFLENDPAWLGSSMAQPQQKRLMLRHLWGPDGIRDNADDDTWVPRSDVSTQKRDAILALKRSFIFRPLREDHPYFGGNPSFEPDQLVAASGTAPAPYDVDNDGDGIADSIWVDLGLPIVTARDGRKYKRLAAILVKDLDNRLDVNVLGNAFIAANANARASTPLSNFAVAGTDVSAPTPVNVARGIGFGPAEHDFSHLFSAAAAYNQLLSRRYGNDGQPGAAGTDDFHSSVMTIGIPNDHLNQYSSYTTPPDVWGRGALALDYFGTPAWWDQTQMGSSERIDDPYEVQFDARRSRADAPYTIAEMEPLLRYHDQGIRGMQSRLLVGAIGNDLASSFPGSLGPDHVRRAMLTTRSASLPVPQVVVPPELRGTTGTLADETQVSIMEYYHRRLTAMPKEPELREMVPFEFRHGRLFNINREFGNGVNDAAVSSNGGVPPTYNFPEDPLGVVDDPGESYRDLTNPPRFDPREKIWSNQISLEHENPELPPAVTATYPVVPGYPAPGRIDPRQIMARHLYCLAMFLWDQSNASGHYDYYGDGAWAGATPDPEMARMIAQWAVNVVDFRDADSINTGFEYDVNPLDGWSVDGDLSTSADRGVASAPTGDIVWGVERPELLITETLAWHDRRTEDLTNETPDMAETAADVAGGDDDFDQRLLPRGAVFVELFNPWVDRSGGSYDHKRPEFNNGAGPMNGVELHRINNGGSPVWRLLIVKDSLVNSDPDFDTDPDVAAASNLGPEHWARNPPTTPEDIERSVYFVLPGTAAALPTSGHGDPFFLPPSVADPNNPTQPLISPLLAGRYAVIGGFDAEVPQGGGVPPHYISYAGRRTDALEGGALNETTTRRIELQPQNNVNTPQFYVMDNAAAAANDFNVADVQNTIAIPIQDLSVSEPPPSSPTPYPAATGATADGEPMYTPPIDTPLDGDSSLQQNTTTSRYRRVFLQRLANPLLAWDMTVNPYVTVDASDIDMTAFNGAAVDAADPNIGMGNFRSFQTFQRGGPFPDIEVPGYAYNLAGTRGYRNLWKHQESYGIPSQNSPAEGAVGPHFFPLQLYHTLGYLNRRYWPFYTTSGNNGMPVIPPFLMPQYGRYVGAPGPTDGEDMQPRTFPWLTHLDRPYTSPMELLMVPVTSQSRLLADFNLNSPTLQDLYSLPWDPANANVMPYMHQFNFLHSRTSGMPPFTAEGPGMYRLFDFLEVPSPYAETETVYNPDFFSTASAILTGNINNGAIPTYRPPFSRQTHFSDPGKINVNTIYDARVWEALVNQYPEFDPTSAIGQAHFIRMMLSRQGFGSQQTDLLVHQATYPSLFSNPFRAANAADLAPPLPSGSMRPIGPDATLLRRDPNDTTNTNKPLMVRAPAGGAPPAAHDDPERNSYFRYQGLQKVASSLTTHSNVFAVWVTIGYFEVEENRTGAGNTVVVDAGHPDGYRLGQEVGGDAGQIRRSRAFYIIDRSVPVAFENGKRHNTDKAVLLRRFIE